MNRTLLHILTWGTVVGAVACALLLADAVDRLDPGVDRPLTRAASRPVVALASVTAPGAAEALAVVSTPGQPPPVTGRE